MLLDMSTNELVKLFSARAHRRFQHGLTRKPMALIKKLRKAKQGLQSHQPHALLSLQWLARRNSQLQRKQPLSACLCQKVQRALVQSDIHSRSDKSPVSVADYGSQALVNFVLERELQPEPFSLIAEEDSGDLHKGSTRLRLELHRQCIF